jgi:hypothetical protein
MKPTMVRFIEEKGQPPPDQEVLAEAQRDAGLFEVGGHLGGAPELGDE